MRYLISLFLVIATPTLGQYQFSDGGYGYGPAGIGENFDGYGSQIHNGLPAIPGRNRGSRDNEVLRSSEFGLYGPEPGSSWNNRIPEVTGGSRRPPSRDRNHGGRRRHGRHGTNEIDSGSDSEYDSSGDQHPRRYNYKDRHNTGWTESVENPFTSGRGGRRNNGRRRPRPNGRRPSRKGRRGRDSSSEGSSASSRSSNSRSSSEEENRRRRNGRNRKVGSGLGPGVITFPGIDLRNIEGLFNRAADAGRDFLDESGDQTRKLAKRIIDNTRQNSEKIGETLKNGVGSVRDSAQNMIQKLPGAAGQNGTALTLSSFRNPDFVRKFLENIYNTMNSWGQVLKQLPGNIWNRFENLINCMNGNCPE